MGRRNSAGRLALATTIASAIVGCHGGTRTAVSPSPSTTSASTPPTLLPGHAFGDAATLSGVRVLLFDPAKEQVRVTTTNPKNLIVLAVVPGREIEVVQPGDYPVRREREKDVFTIDMRRASDEITPEDAAAITRTRLAYDRCIKQAEATAARIAQQKARSVRRDSTGKVIGGGPTAPDIVDTRSCDRLSQHSAVKRTPTFLPARAPADRYLVVLTSTSPISRTQLYERLATLTAVAPDVATTIEAIAAGLYVGVKGTWGGYFVAW